MRGARKRRTVAKGRQPSTPRTQSKTWEPDIENDLKQVIAEQDTVEPTGEPGVVSDDESLPSDAPLVRLVNSILHEAIKRDVSDIHIEPFEGLLRVRFRNDGVLEEIQKIPFKLAPAISSRIKIMANLDICEKRIPQDGVINYRSGELGADLRVSTLPSVFGEKIVMRVLGTTNLNNDLSKVGIPKEQLKLFRKAIKQPNGMVLVTGPTGSGKTTTLYGALNELNDIGISVFTAEDPVEGNLPGVTQCQANAGVGYTFSSILRALLRQDPDVILVGEIRDQETAEIAIKASLTGHMVLSTLHTNCSVATIQRLVDIGIKPYLITSSINCIVAQRLVRRICEGCKEKRPISNEMLQSMDLDPKAFSTGNFAHGVGCEECHGSGFKGRAAVYEVLVLNDDLRSMILKGASKSQLKTKARECGLQTLRESALELVRQGVTSIEEALGRTAEDEDPIEMQAGASSQASQNVMSPQMMQQMMNQMLQAPQGAAAPAIEAQIPVAEAIAPPSPTTEVKSIESEESSSLKPKEFVPSEESPSVVGASASKLEEQLAQDAENKSQIDSKKQIDKKSSASRWKRTGGNEAR